mgnify:CR=1 FL=1
MTQNTQKNTMLINTKLNFPLKNTFIMELTSNLKGATITANQRPMFTVRTVYCTYGNLW